MSGNVPRPHPLIDEALRVMGFTLDKQLALETGIHFTSLAQIRHGRRPVRDGFILALHEATGIPIRRIKELAGLPPAQLSAE